MRVPLPTKRFESGLRFLVTFERLRLSGTYPTLIHSRPVRHTTSQYCCITSQATPALFAVRKIRQIECLADSSPGAKRAKRQLPTYAAHPQHRNPPKAFLPDPKPVRKVDTHHQRVLMC